jgi:hypothetical protein
MSFGEFGGDVKTGSEQKVAKETKGRGCAEKWHNRISMSR